MEGVPASSSFAPHLRILRLVGYARLSEDKVRYRRIHQAFRTFIFMYFTAVFLQEIVYTVLCDDLVKFASAMLFMLSHTAAYAKLTVLRMKEDKVFEVINAFNDPLFNQVHPAHKVILQESAATARRLVHTFLAASMSTCFIWTIFPILDYYTGKHVELYYWVGNLDYHRSPSFELLFSYEMILIGIVAFGNTGIDAFIACILAQCKTQITLLRYNFEHLYEISKDYSNKHGGNFETTLNKELIKCIHHYEKIHKITKQHQDIFGKVIFYQFNVSGWIFCMTAYKAVNVSPLSVEFAVMNMFMLCMLLELSLFCYYGNEVKFESERLIESIYQMDWLKTPVSFQKSLVILMERFKRPIAPSAMSVIPLSLETFVKILKSSYTFYAVINKTKN